MQHLSNHSLFPWLIGSLFLHLLVALYPSEGLHSNYSVPSSIDISFSQESPRYIPNSGLSNPKSEVRTITSAARLPADALYFESWRYKVERVGQLNYPIEAKRLNLYGALRMSVVISPDGALQQARVIHSSGNSVLDQAALRIIKLSSPFAPPPGILLKGAGMLEIIAPWQFLKTHKLITKNHGRII